MPSRNLLARLFVLALVAFWVPALAAQGPASSTDPDPATAQAREAQIGQEVGIPVHLQDGEEYTTPLPKLLAYGKKLFTAVWTDEEGGGRPLTKGTGKPLTDPSSPLTFPRNFDRISGPEANSCAGCHNTPRAGGGGDIVGNVFVLGQRFDHVTFDPNDPVPTRGSVDERGNPVTLPDVANSRATLGMFGSGYIEMLARQITFDLRAEGLALGPGQSVALQSTGISFGTLSRRADGTWDTSAVEGLAPESLASDGPGDPPSLIIRPFHQVGAVVSLREFTTNAFNQHHGMQAEERFGKGMDPDGDGFTNELTRADLTAISVWQATLPAPGRVIPRNRAIEDAVLAGEATFSRIGCADCHVPALALRDGAEYYYEPNPFNPPGNLQPGDAPLLKVDLDSDRLPGPRLEKTDGVTWVPAYTDLKLHDITSGPDDPNREPLNQHAPAGSDAFFAGNGRFLTKKLWGLANEPPFFHNGLYTTMRGAILAHAGEAQVSADAFRALSDYDRATVIEFLKTLQVLPPGTRSQVVDERGRPRQWPPARAR